MCLGAFRLHCVVCALRTRFLIVVDRIGLFRVTAETDDLSALLGTRL